MHFLLPYDLRERYRPGKVSPEFEHLIMPHAKGIQTSGDFGTIITQVYKGSDYEIWQHHFKISSGIQLSAFTDRPILTINYMLQGSPAVTLPVIGEVILEEHTAQLFYVPSIRYPVWFSKGEYHCVHIVFSPSYIKRLLPAYPGLQELLEHFTDKREEIMLHTSGKINTRIHTLVDQILLCNMNKGETDLNFQSRIIDLIRDFVHRYAPANNRIQEEPSNNKEFLEIRAFIESNIDKPLCIKDLSRKSAKSQSEFHRLFKLHFNQSPHQFIHALRLQKASELLQGTGHSISYIAAQVGFESVSHFSNAFKKMNGKSPGFYRKQ